MECAGCSSSVPGLVPTPALSSNAGVGGAELTPLRINKRCNAGVAGSALPNRGLQVRFLPGLFSEREASPRVCAALLFGVDIYNVIHYTRPLRTVAGGR